MLITNTTPSSLFQKYYEVPRPLPTLPPRPQHLSPFGDNIESGQGLLFPASNDNAYETVPDHLSRMIGGILDDDDETSILKAKLLTNMGMHEDTYACVPDPMSPMDAECNISNDTRTSVLECEVLSLISEEEGEAIETSDSDTVAEKDMGDSARQNRPTVEEPSDRCVSSNVLVTKNLEGLDRNEEEIFDESGYMVPNVRMTYDGMTSLTIPASIIDSDDDLEIFRVAQQDSCFQYHSADSKEVHHVKKSENLRDTSLSTSADGQLSLGAASVALGRVQQMNQNEEVIDESGYMVPDVIMEGDGGGSRLPGSKQHAHSLHTNRKDDILHVDIRNLDCFVLQTDDTSTDDIHHTYHDLHQVDNSSDAIHHTYHVSHEVSSSKEDPPPYLPCFECR